MIERQVKKEVHREMRAFQEQYFFGGWGQGMVSDNATGLQPIDFGEVRALSYVQPRNQLNRSGLNMIEARLRSRVN